jgi:hypothetical protein
MAQQKSIIDPSNTAIVEAPDNSVPLPHISTAMDLFLGFIYHLSTHPLALATSKFAPTWLVPTTTATTAMHSGLLLLLLLLNAIQTVHAFKGRLVIKHRAILGILTLSAPSVKFLDTTSTRFTPNFYSPIDRIVPLSFSRGSP